MHINDRLTEHIKKSSYISPTRLALGKQVDQISIVFSCLVLYTVNLFLFTFFSESL